MNGALERSDEGIASPRRRMPVLLGRGEAILVVALVLLVSGPAGAFGRSPQLVQHCTRIKHAALCERRAGFARRRRAEARQYNVYFGLGVDELTPEAAQVVAEAAEYAREIHARRLSVVGYADTAGPHQLNLELSRGRAASVAGALEVERFGKGHLDVSWMGDKGLAVRTGHGVPEPLNREVTIDIEP